jgi:arylsulfatase A-like enzyme
LVISLIELLIQNSVMKHFKDRVAFAILLSLFPCSSHAGSSTPRHPNVLVILADDQAWGDLTFTGNRNLSTPNIDALAKSGTSFDRFYVCPLCAPTRAEFLTGRYHPRAGVSGVSTGRERLNLDEKTIADAFKAAGYRTGIFGKWHNGSQWPYHPNARGFDEFYGFTSGHWGEYFDPPLDHNGQPVRGHGYIADDFTEHALSFIETNKDRPFFCYLAFNTPHSPFAVPEKYWSRFKGKSLAQRARPSDPEDLDETRCVLAMCENLDWNVGRILQKLDELNLNGDTIVIYFSDNGPAGFRWNGDMKGRKGTTDEGGVRVPFFIRWPEKIKAGATAVNIAGAIDLLPTLTSMAGIPRVGSKPLDGIDLSPFILGTSVSVPDRKIFSNQNGNVSVRTQRYRFDNAGALFDMTSDPGQRTNVSFVFPGLASQLSHSVAEWREDVLGNGTTRALKPGQAIANNSPSRRNGVKAERQRAREARDTRPFPVGYRELARAPLPARDGVPHGTIHRSGSAPNSSYFVNWTNLNDTITWDIEVATAGMFSVELLYTCPETDAGSTIELSFEGAKLTGKVQPAWDPPLYTNQDTIPRRHGESQMKDFHVLALGNIHLDNGRGPLKLRALQIPGKSVMDLRSVALTLQ